MKKILISNFPVGPKFNGGSMTVWGIIKYFLDNKTDFFLILTCSENQKNTKRFNECIKILETYNIDYELFFFNEQNSNFFKKLINLSKTLVFGNPVFFFPDHYKLKTKIEHKLNKFLNHQIICYHFDVLSSCYEVKNIDLLLGDFIHEPRISRRSLENRNILYKFVDFIERLAGFRVMKKLTEKSRSIGFFSYNYAIQFSKKIRVSRYFRTPIVDVDEFKQDKLKKFNLNFLMVGHLQGTVTISSLKFLEKLINKFENYLVLNRINFNIVGGNKLSKINNVLKKKNNLVNFHGESFQIDNFYKTNNFLLVPNEIDIGIRVRIITGLSFGAIIITHKSNLKGIPELKNNENCLIFNNEEELIDIIEMLKNDKIDLDKIKIKAKKTFYDYFYYKGSVKEILKKINYDK